MTHVRFHVKNIFPVLIMAVITVVGIFAYAQSTRAYAVSPVLNINAPLAGSVNKGTAVITFTSESDATPLVAECSIDNFVSTTICTTGVTTLADIPGFTAHAEGAFTLSIQDTDSNRFVLTDSEVGVVKDTVAPIITPTAPTNGSLIGSMASVVYTLNGDVDSGTITFDWTGGSSDRNSHVFVIARQDATSGTHTLTLQTLEAGFGNVLIDGATYSIIFVVTDAAGNESVHVTRTSITLDLIPPSTPSRLHITSSNGISSLAKVGDTVSVTALVDSGTRVTGTIGGKTVSVSSVIGIDATISRVLDGTETEGVNFDFTLISTDGAGNESQELSKISILDDSHVETDFTAPSIPLASPDTGTYTGTQSVILVSSGSTSIRYTTNGTTPTCSVGTVYTISIPVALSTTIKAVGCDAAGNISAVASFIYTINASGGGGSITAPSIPLASPAAGTYTGTQSVILVSSGSTSIRYTTNGTTPTCSVGTVYTISIPVALSTTIKAVGCNAIGTISPLATFIYTINASSGGGSVSVPGVPIANPVAGTYSSTQNVTLSSTGATSIRYTTNGTTPTCSVGTVYTGAIPVSSTKTIKAKGCGISGVASALATFLYTINISSGGGGSGSSTISPPSLPIASPVAGTYTSSLNVVLSSVGATSIRYTTNGTTPSCSVGTVYTGAIPVSSTKTIKARGCNTSGITSSLATFVYTINAALPSQPIPNTSGTPSVTSTTPVVIMIHDPAQYVKLLSDFGLKSDPTNFELYKSLTQSDANSFGVLITTEQVRVISNFETYGASAETIKLGSGERRALIRDYFETVGRGDVVWDDIQRLTIGQKPVKRNLLKEQAQAGIALQNFRKMIGHDPDFKNPQEDIAWNTLLYRIRFPRDLVKEQYGISRFNAIFKRAPKTPSEWAIVRALGYVLR